MIHAGTGNGSVDRNLRRPCGPLRAQGVQIIPFVTRAGRLRAAQRRAARRQIRLVSGWAAETRILVAVALTKPLSRDLQRVFI
jgi:hypothetical protein